MLPCWKPAIIGGAQLRPIGAPPDYGDDQDEVDMMLAENPAAVGLPVGAAPVQYAAQRPKKQRRPELCKFAAVGCTRGHNCRFSHDYIADGVELTDLDTIGPEAGTTLPPLKTDSWPDDKTKKLDAEAQKAADIINTQHAKAPMPRREELDATPSSSGSRHPVEFYTCSHCSNAYGSSRSLRKHIALRHPEAPRPKALLPMPLSLEQRMAQTRRQEAQRIGQWFEDADKITHPLTPPRKRRQGELSPSE